MARFLVSNEYPHGHELGAILDGIRREVLKGSPMDLLNEAMSLAGSMFGIPGLRSPVPVAVPTRRASRPKHRTHGL